MALVIIFICFVRYCDETVVVVAVVVVLELIICVVEVMAVVSYGCSGRCSMHF